MLLGGRPNADIFHRHAIEAAGNRRRGGDPFRVLRLKKLKLAVKDRLAALMRRPLYAR